MFAAAFLALGQIEGWLFETALYLRFILQILRPGKLFRLMSDRLFE